MQSLLLAVPAYVFWLIFGGFFAIILTALIVILPFKIWFRALISGVPVGFLRLIGMQLRKNKPALIIEAYINSKKAGVNITIDELETHYMAGGDVIKVTNALIAALHAKIPLTSATAKAIDLAGRDVYAAVKNSVTPKVIETPTIIAVAANGIELRIRMRVTVKVNISRLIGGAGEETVIARIVEGVVTTVGTADNHSDVLQNPDVISKTILEKGLDYGTAFEILSIDVASMEIGENISAKLRISQAEADKKIAQAKAEERRAMAIAAEQEMRAEKQRAEAMRVVAESEVPKAMAKAFESGNIGIMDYQKLQNIAADTAMRKALAEEDDDDDKKGGAGGFKGFRGGNR